MIIPIRTETQTHRTPVANGILLALNVLLFAVFDFAGGPELQHIKDQHFLLHTAAPSIHEFITYQFVHGDITHLIGNMLFLWVFGNAVNAKMGNLSYLLFYLAAGVFAAFGFALSSSADLLGASGAIAGVTTAYLVLFPRSRVTVIYWLIFIGTTELPAMLFIGLKIVLWDNIMSPRLSGGGNVAFNAHLAGYLFGLVVPLCLLLFRLLPRDQFDLLALFKRWNQRRAFQSALADPDAAAQATYGRIARPVTLDPNLRQAEEAKLDQVSGIRVRISECINTGDIGAAATLYEQLVGIDPAQCLSARHQMTIAREFYSTGRTPQAASTFERYLTMYANTDEAAEVQLLLGIIYARDLGQFEAASRHLGAVRDRLQPQRQAQCDEWLGQIRQSLSQGGNPASS